MNAARFIGGRRGGSACGFVGSMEEVSGLKIVWDPEDLKIPPPYFALFVCFASRNEFGGGSCSGCSTSGVSVTGVGATFIDDVVGAGRSRGREETGVKRSSWAIVVGGASAISIGTRRVRGFGKGGVERAGLDRFECSSSSVSATTF